MTSIDIDKVDIEILSMLCKLDKVSPLYSIQVKDIVNKFSYSIAYYTIVRRLQKLIEKNYISDGYKCRNAKTYYITEKGSDFIKKEIFEKENVDIPEEIYNDENKGEDLSD